MITTHPTPPVTLQAIQACLSNVLAGFPNPVFASVAQGRKSADSDLDIAVAAHQAQTVVEKMDLLPAQTHRPIDLVDLKVLTEPLLDQLVLNGHCLFSSDKTYGELISHQLFQQADINSYRNSALAERQEAWIAN